MTMDDPFLRRVWSKCSGDDARRVSALVQEVKRLREKSAAVYDVVAAVDRMKAWANANGQADTQGLMDDEWEALARAALGRPQPRCGPWDEREDGTHVCRKCGRLDPLDFEEFDDA